MKKYPKDKFPKKETMWSDFIHYHNFENWEKMCDTIVLIVGNWEGQLPYELYSEWFDIYYSPLYQALRETND